MGQDLRIDSHKLIFHPRRVASWLEGDDVAPLYVEISPAGSCNHRCRFCALDYMGYQRRFLDTAMLKERLGEMAVAGVKSAMFAGEGEPLLHRDLAGLVEHAKAAGIDVAVTTNGVLLTPGLAERLIPCLTWLRVSLNAGTAATYAEIHGTRPRDFETVLTNLSHAVRIRDEMGSGCTLGVQILLLPENAHEVEALAASLRDAGLDYLAVKPYSQHLKSQTRRYEGLDYRQYRSMKGRLASLETARFHVVFRDRSMAKMEHDADRGYESCLALPFWAYVDAGGGLWGCSAHLGDERFCFGNLYANTFSEIWHGEKRRRFVEEILPTLDTDQCRRGCRMDEINRYLWELTHPAPHANFI